MPSCVEELEYSDIILTSDDICIRSALGSFVNILSMCWVRSLELGRAALLSEVSEMTVIFRLPSIVRRSFCVRMTFPSESSV